MKNNSKWMVGYLHGNPEDDQPMFEHKDMERKREFLVHISTVYPWMKSSLKEVYHSLENWRGYWDTYGWKFRGKEITQKTLVNKLSDQILHGM